MISSLDCVHATAEEPPRSNCTKRVAWSFSVQAQDVFVLCRALLICGEVEVQRCTAVVRQGRARVRVDITLVDGQAGTVLHQVIQHVNDAEVGRLHGLNLA